MLIGLPLPELETAATMSTSSGVEGTALWVRAVVTLLAAGLAECPHAASAPTSAAAMTQRVLNTRLLRHMLLKTHSIEADTNRRTVARGQRP
jgi:hypothetical protein